MKATEIGRFLLYLLLCNVRTSIAQFTQYAPYTPNVKSASKVSACDGSSKTALVEHFFNVIFNEFHSNPPVCVCVQMCLDQPTYCYPNGCLKKVDNKKKVPDDNRPSAPVANVHNIDAINKMFFVDDKNDFTHMLNENADTKNVPLQRPGVRDMRPDPFKDRYKILFKYKKMPKVEFRYNLREQVKNMKSDILKVETKDVSKTRWPNVNHMTENQAYKANEKKNDRKTPDSSNPKFFVTNDESYTPRYFKRDLRRNLKDEIDVDTEYLADNPLDNKNFSIETLIENLIGNNYGGKRDADDETADMFKDLKTNTTDEVIPTTETGLSSNGSKTNEQTCVVSMNMTNQNLDKNKYDEYSPLVKERMDKWQNYTFNEMIAALSKRIDKQNNTSMEILKQASSSFVESSENTTKPCEASLKTAVNSPLHNTLTEKIQTVIITKKNDVNTGHKKVKENKIKGNH